MAKSYLDYILVSEKVDESIYPNQYLVTEEILKKLSSGKSPARMIGVAKMKEELPDDGNFVLYLDDVQDPGNVGTIFRTALAFNFKTIYVSNKSAYKYNSKVIQASQGSIFDLNIKNGSKESLLKLKNDGYQVISTALNSKTIKLGDFKFKKSGKYVIILGNEGNGVNKELIELSNACVKINIVDVESLNVAVAGAIIMNEIFNNGV